MNKNRTFANIVATALFFGMIPSVSFTASAAAEAEYDMKTYGGITLEELYSMDGYSESDGNIEISDFTITSVNREEAVSSDSLESYSSTEKALNKESEYKISLNGEWKFNYVIKPEDKPEDFFKTDYDVSGWDTIKIPSNNELNGYGVPLYENVTSAMSVYNSEFSQSNYQSLGAEMTMPTEYNPVASYVRTVEIPQDWNERDTYIAFDGAETCIYIWVNGTFVGYSTDSFTQKVFNITDYVHEGDNTIACRTYTYSNGVWLEDQDYITFSGLSREVALYSKPKTHIRDFEVETDLDSTYTDAVLSVTANITGENAEAVTAEAILYKGTDVIDSFALDTESAYGTDRVLYGELDVINPQKWTAETPNLYNLTITLKDSDGNELESQYSRIGFREVEINGTLMTINGKKLMLKGVNRHEHSPINGRAVTRDEMIQDIKVMKQFNMNAVRTCHYPDSKEWYELCDEYGLYVMDEINLETHGWRNWYPKGNSSWTAQCLDRAKNMFERDKNRACVVIWSLGNEAGNGNNFKVMREWFHDNDKSERPVHYEGDRNNSDIDSSMYAGVSKMEDKGKNVTDKPVLQCEYSHSMGNSLGNHKEYWEVYEKYENQHGGYIWDFADQSVLWCDIHGAVSQELCNDSCIKYYSYGGDWEDFGAQKYGITSYYEEVGAAANSENFCANGMFNTDRTPKPGAYEVKHVQQSIKVNEIDADNGQFSITNKYNFIDLSDFEGKYTIYEDDTVLKCGTIDINVQPGETEDYTVNYGEIVPTAGAQYRITFEFCLKNDTAWADTGYLMAWDQYEITELCTDKNVIEVTDSIEKTETESSIIISNDKLEVEFDKATGNMTKYSYKGRDILTSSDDTMLLEPDFSRMFCDNDFGNKMFSRSKNWSTAAEHRNLESIEIVAENESSIRIKTLYKLGNNAKTVIYYDVMGDGSIVVNNLLDPVLANSTSEIPLVGNRLTLNPEYSNVKWYGKGPYENYIDRNNGSMVGVYESNVDDLFFDYIRPQLTGNMTGVRYVALTNDEGNGILARPLQAEFEFTALRYTAKDVNTQTLYDGSAKDKTEGTRHAHELPETTNVYLNLNYKQGGIGGSNSWGSGAEGYPLPQYQLSKSDTYSYGYILTPITNQTDNIALARATYSIAEIPNEFDHTCNVGDIIYPENLASINGTKAGITTVTINDSFTKTVEELGVVSGEKLGTVDRIGYIGRGFGTTSNDAGSAVFIMKAEKDMNATLKLLAQTGEDRKISVRINEDDSTIQTCTADARETVGNKLHIYTINNIKLSEGENIVEISADGASDYAPDIIRLRLYEDEEVTPAPTPETNTVLLYPSDNTACTGKKTAVTNGSLNAQYTVTDKDLGITSGESVGIFDKIGYVGDGFGTSTGDSGAVSFSFESQYTGKADIKILGVTNQNRNVSVRLNNDDETITTCLWSERTDASNMVGNMAVRIYILRGIEVKKGTNTIDISAVQTENDGSTNSAAPDIMRIAIVQAEEAEPTPSPVPASKIKLDSVEIDGGNVLYTVENTLDEPVDIYVALHNNKGKLISVAKGETGVLSGYDKDVESEITVYAWKKGTQTPAYNSVKTDMSVYVEKAAYLFVHFVGSEDTANDEQIYFSVSQDAESWTTLNNGVPILKSNLGTKGVRDPHIVRSPQGDKFYMIATDLSIYHNGNWNDAQKKGSQSIMVWESTDLINWSEGRLVKIGTDDSGCVWAPESFYDETRDAYMVFWASRVSSDNYGKQRIYRSWTTDFITFTEPEIYVEKAYDVIDSTIVKSGDTFYRYSKDESSKAIICETSDSLDSKDWTLQDGFVSISGTEGPTCFKLNGNNDQWCLFADYYSSTGYAPFKITDITSGEYEKSELKSWQGTHFRHGSVIPITLEEYNELCENYPTEIL